MNLNRLRILLTQPFAILLQGTFSIAIIIVIVRGQEVAFTPGMTANGEIVTRKKSILTFIIEPVTRRFSEAFSVR
jgi:hypothetical protein